MGKGLVALIRNFFSPNDLMTAVWLVYVLGDSRGL